LFCFTLFLLASFYIKNPKKIRILGCCFYLSTFSFAEMATPENTKLCDFTSTNNSDFICTPIAPPALYDFYFIVVPREASNSSEVKIWGCCCPETVFDAAP
jgi:hypothetical protein